MFRKVPSTAKKFTISLTQNQWSNISPHSGVNKLKKTWTNVIHSEFKRKNPSCVLHFTYQHVRVHGSRKRNAPYLTLLAVCKFSTCQARYIIRMKNKPSRRQPTIRMAVIRQGEIKHLKNETRFRPATNIRRGKIAKSVVTGVSAEYYRRLRTTPVSELVSGNLTKSLNKNILRVIAAEVQKSRKLHDNVLLEMQLMQGIMRECDSSYYTMPGYVHHLQVNPLGIHLYTETGLSILVHHLRMKKPVSLYLDATGGVVSKPPEDKRRVLYYAMALPGHGQDAPPLPVTEMISNEHSVPPLRGVPLPFG